LVEEAGASSILIDSGNFLFKTSKPDEYAKPYFQLKARFVARAYDALSYDATVLSEVDFALGWRGLKAVLDGSNFKILAGNLALFDKPLLPMVHIVEGKGIYVGLIGMLARRPPGLIDDGVTVSDLKDSVIAATQRIGSFCDVVILLLAGNKKDAITLALGDTGNIPHIIVFSDSRYATGSSSLVNNVLLLEGAGLGRYLGKLSLKIYRGQSPVKDFRCEFIPIKYSIKRDGKVAPLTDEYKKEVRDLSIAIARQKTELLPQGKGFYWGKDLCMNCHPKQARLWKKGVHSKAFDTLKKVGREMDVECLPCHTLGFQKEAGYTNPVKGHEYANVQCENCHGPGSRHDSPEYKSLLRDSKMCTQCHDEERSPDFNYENALKMGSCRPSIALSEER
jgi:predicted CXXCH cytochrome family protein